VYRRTVSRAAYLSVLVASTLAVAADLPLRLSVDSAAFVGRSGGPIPLRLRVEWGGAGLLEGRLAFELEDPGIDVLMTVQTDELYLTSGTHELSLLLPSLSSSGFMGELQLLPSYIDGNERFRLDPLMLRVPSSTQRRLVVLLGEGAAIRPQPVEQLLDSLKLERLAPMTPRWPLTTVIESRPPRDFPEDPLWLCPYEMLVLFPECWRELSTRQLEAVWAWTRSGGSLLLVVEGAGAATGRIELGHVEFLERLLSREHDKPDGVAVTSSGAIMLPEGESRWVHRSPGLGRVVVVPSAPSAFGITETNAPSGTGARAGTSGADDWTLPGQSLAHLWKVQQVHLDAIVTDDSWDLDYLEASVQEELNRWALEGRPARGPLSESSSALITRFYPQPVPRGAGLVQMLLPGNLKLVPLSALFGLLVLYVATIGPLDYWLLGRLRLRRLTWVLFPCVTVAFTAAGVWLSNRYMSTGDHRGVLAIRDVDAEGRVLRESRIELLMVDRSRTVRSEYRRALVIPLQTAELVDEQYQWQFAGRQSEFGTGDLPRPVIEGRPPGHAALVQSLRQWRPQLNRSLTIPLMRAGEEPVSTGDSVRPRDPRGAVGGLEGSEVAEAPVMAESTSSAPPESGVATGARRSTGQSAFDWSVSVDPRNVDTSGLRNRVQAAYGSEAAAYLYTGEARHSICGPDYFLSREFAGVETVEVAGRVETRTIDFLQHLCVRLQGGWFRLVSRTSPGCSPYLEDLVLLDRTNPRAAVLVIAVHEPEGVVLYRRLFEADDTPERGE
jgi:hypothetical protein